VEENVLLARLSMPSFWIVIGCLTGRWLILGGSQI